MNAGEPLPVGYLLDGRYRIHNTLGQGGMGRVYLANDTRLSNRPVAAKEMVLGDGVQEKKAIEDFNREASVLARLSHPSIPQVIDFFAEHGRHYLVMEYVAGGDLQHRFDQLGPKARIAEGQVLAWSRQILDVLAFLHSQKPPLVYRDLKPGNIMIDQQGRAMLIDFGIARFLPPGGRGTQIGSIGYAPPEQYLGKMEPRSDLYALAATIHHLLTGRDPQLEPPFSFPPVRQLAPEVSPQTESVVMQALDKDIDKRPSSAREMRDRLPTPDMPIPVAISTPNQSASRGVGGAAMGQMATIVLARPVAAASPAPQNALSAGPNADARTQRSLKLPLPPTLPRQKPAEPAGNAKTRDLGVRAKPRSSAVAKAAGIAFNRLKGLNARDRMKAAVSTLRANTSPPPPFTPKPRIQEVPKPDRHPSSNNAIHAPAQPRAASAWLIAGDGSRFGLTTDRTLLGRGSKEADSASIDLSKLKRGGERVSHRHAEIVKEGSDFFIRDLGSLNGTWVAGRGRLGRDQLYKLRDHDEIVLGGAKLEFKKG